ncbi:MAG: hypothetical protein WD042_16875 [Phycisphaeraceae bacterium]
MTPLRLTGSDGGAPVCAPGLIQPLPGLPRRPLTPQEQLEALRRLQLQAEHRLKLGMQLFKAAEAHTAQHQSTLEEIQAEQKQLREQVQADVARSLRDYDQWVGNVEKHITQRLDKLDGRLSALQSHWENTEQHLTSMAKRAETLLDQCRCLMDEPLPVQLRQLPGVPGAPAAGLPGAAAMAGEQTPAPTTDTNMPDTASPAPTQVASDPAIPTLYTDVLSRLHVADGT